jgi:nitroimidazol reductase NimA-like FMN-containing flavoprotein (pyridoxamine 5'-phosphate oxidase superfamily)
MAQPGDRTEVRRRDRAVQDEAWMKAMLSTAATGVLATVQDGQPFLNANLFVYDEARHAIYLHTARRGHTRDVVERNDRVAFTVMELGRLLPADTALEFSTEYASVMAFGRGQVVTVPGEAEYGLQLLLDKYFDDLAPGRDYHAITAEELKRTSVFRVDIEEWVGKRKTVAADFPGARAYPETSMLTPDRDPAD